MRIEVTQERIDRGKRQHACVCPVALALIPHMPKGTTFYVREYGLEVCEHVFDANKWQVNFPREVVEFITAFDRGDPVSPFAFELPIDALVAGGEG